MYMSLFTVHMYIGVHVRVSLFTVHMYICVHVQVSWFTVHMFHTLSVLAFLDEAFLVG